MCTTVQQAGKPLGTLAGIAARKVAVEHVVFTGEHGWMLGSFGIAVAKILSVGFTGDGTAGGISTYQTQ